GVKPFEVGFAGMKDRNAVTTQHYTVPRGKRSAEEFAALKGEGYEVLSAAAHQRKLPRGALEGNRFVITVRGLRCEAALLGARLRLIASGGTPNYFGEQRFGREAGNLAQVLGAAKLLAEGRSRGGRDRRGRDDAGFMLSAARSLIFNAMLAKRVEQGSWNRLSAGDVANLDGRGSVFAVDAVNEDLESRCATLDVHPTAPLAGAGESLAAGAVLALEDSVSARFPEALAVIHAEGMKPERRALRTRVRDLTYEYAADTLQLRFTLSAGSFATTVLREIISSAATGE
ncbi:MAG: tRNA pseudouridine(13) synthase TruD, partial [Pseudomonadota bacterium]